MLRELLALARPAQREMMELQALLVQQAYKAQRATMVLLELPARVAVQRAQPVITVIMELPEPQALLVHKAQQDLVLRAQLVTMELPALPVQVEEQQAPQGQQVITVIMELPEPRAQQVHKAQQDLALRAQLVTMELPALPVRAAAQQAPPGQQEIMEQME